MRLFLVLGLLLIASCEDDDNQFAPEVITPETENTEDQISSARIPCENGMAGDYPCEGYDLMARIAPAVIDDSGLNDIWGWTDPTTSKEYAIVGAQSKTAFIDVTDAEDPVIVGFLPTATSSTLWRDIKVYQNHAFIVSEAPDHGMQVFDLTRLRNPEDEPIIFDADAHYTEFGNAHNIAINESSGYAYAVGTQTYQGGPHFINIQNPSSPLPAGGYSGSNYTHDAQVVQYSGPDTDFTGKEIFLGSNGSDLVIVDVSDKDAPQLISSIAHTNVGYTHQGWFDENHTFFYANDELDETEFGVDTRTLVFDLSDLNNPLYVGPYFGPTEAIDHNLYVHNNELYLSNYTAGLRVADISNPALDQISDIGYFDTFPANNATSIAGVWSVYPFFASGNILISDISTGFFIVRKSGT